jgi:DNA-binding HxlR family transcriptional regulator
MARYGKWKRDDVALRILSSLAVAAEHDKVLGFNALAEEAGVSKKTLLYYLPTLLDAHLATFMMIGKRQQYYITPRGASVKKALQHECKLKVDFANLEVVPMPAIEPNVQATLAIHNITQQKQNELKALTANYAKMVNRIVGGSTTRVMLSINHPETPKEE